jgi:periplasmic protein CpxP/Spy
MMHKGWIALCVVSMASGAALAADQPSTGHHGWDRAGMEQMRAKREAARADDMAVLLGLRADQRPAFDRYLASMRPMQGGPDGKPGGSMDHPRMEEMALPARLDAMQAEVDRHDAMAKQRIAATRTFYASLTPDQQRRFEALDHLRHDHMGHHGGWRGFHHGGPGGPEGAPPPPPAA